MDTTKHRPLPWEVFGELIESSDGEIVGRGSRAEFDRALILTARDSHYENLEEIKVMKEALENITRDYEGFDNTQLERRVNTSGHFRSVVLARAALAKVKP